ncbi:MAG TPA: hypothetical protein PK957_02345 [Candidatus Dojkabacteria bacterium]|nr:hypothetical protein [Candidatus Dojkabacteria bacterium]HQF36395.1 hypothetical protein [Candidatus Dojkabacteria bacterium]
MGKETPLSFKNFAYPGRFIALLNVRSAPNLLTNRKNYSEQMKRQNVQVYSVLTTKLS